jgi:Flp pilus assembly protein TadG
MANLAGESADPQTGFRDSDHGDPMFGIARWRGDRRGVVAVLLGLTAPVLVMALGLGIEVSRWSVAKVELQRIADAAALAGAFDYQHQSIKVPQTAATAAASLAWINGVTGTASPAWTAATQLLADNQIAVQIIAGLKNPGDTAVQVTVSRQLSLYLAGIFTSATSKTISATAVAELIPVATGVACMLALQGSVNGVDPPIDATFSGNASISAGNCVLRSNGDIKMNGNVDVVAAGVVAAGVVTSIGNVSISAPITQNAGQIPDPFASDTAVTSALAQAALVTAAGVNCSSSSCTGPSGCCALNKITGVWQIQPGSYSGLSAGSNATLALAPGLYLVNGSVSFSGNAAVTANGVTIVATGTGHFTGNAAESFTAATTAMVGSGAGAAIPGVMFATSSTGGASFGGNSSFPFSGAIYVPNGTLTISGNATDGASGCGEVVARDVALVGNAQLASNCSSFGLPVIPSQLTTTAMLVQ